MSANSGECYALLNRRYDIDKPTARIHLQNNQHPGKDCLRNVLTVSVAYMLLVSAAQTTSAILTLVLSDTTDQRFYGTSTLGYEVLAIIYTVLSASYWISQPVISRLDPKKCSITGGFCLLIFLCMLFRPLYSTLVAGALVAGVGTALLSTSAGILLMHNSTGDTAGRNSAIFFALLQTSSIWGNLVFYLVMYGKERIDGSARHLIFGCLLILAACGAFLMFFLKYPVTVTNDPRNGAPTLDTSMVQMRSFMHSLMASGEVFQSGRMMMLVPLMVYLGLESAFRVSIYQTCIGYTKSLPDPSVAVVGLSGICAACGEILGSVVSAVLAAKMFKNIWNFLAAAGIFLHIVGFVLVCLIIPTTASRGSTQDSAVLATSAGTVLTISMLLGLGDSCLTIQLFSFIGDIYPKDNLPVFTAFQFFGAASTAAAYLLAGVLDLHPMVVTFGSFGLLSSALFMYTQRRSRTGLDHTNANA